MQTSSYVFRGSKISFQLICWIFGKLLCFKVKLLFSFKNLINKLIQFHERFDRPFFIERNILYDNIHV